MWQYGYVPHAPLKNKSNHVPSSVHINAHCFHPLLIIQAELTIGNFLLFVGYSTTRHLFPSNSWYWKEIKDVFLAFQAWL